MTATDRLDAIWARLEPTNDAQTRTEDVPALLTTLRAVLDLHRRIEVQAITRPLCVREECEHEDTCPTQPYPVCAQCYERCSEAYAYFDESHLAAAIYPCPTVRAIEGALNA